jgi:synaptobrevin family protein YKT6
VYVYVGYIQPNSNVGITVVTDNSYDNRVAFVLIQKVLSKFESAKINYKSIFTDQSSNYDWLDKLLRAYSNPKDADLLLKIQSQVDVVKKELESSLQQILKNGETLDTLLDKSEDLDQHSKKFLKNAKKVNSCCRLF